MALSCILSSLGAHAEREHASVLFKKGLSLVRSWPARHIGLGTGPSLADNSVPRDLPCCSEESLRPRKVSCLLHDLAWCCDPSCNIGACLSRKRCPRKLFSRPSTTKGLPLAKATSTRRR